MSSLNYSHLQVQCFSGQFYIQINLPTLVQTVPSLTTKQFLTNETLFKWLNSSWIKVINVKKNKNTADNLEESKKMNLTNVMMKKIFLSIKMEDTKEMSDKMEKQHKLQFVKNPKQKTYWMKQYNFANIFRD